MPSTLVQPIQQILYLLLFLVQLFSQKLFSSTSSLSCAPHPSRLRSLSPSAQGFPKHTVHWELLGGACVLSRSLHPRLKDMEGRPRTKAISLSESGNGPITSFHSLPYSFYISQVQTNPVFLFFTKNTFFSQKPTPNSSLSKYVRIGSRGRWLYISPHPLWRENDSAWQCP